MSCHNARLLADSVVILAGAIAVGLGNLTLRSGEPPIGSYASMTGFVLLVIAGLMFLSDYYRSWLTDTK